MAIKPMPSPQEIAARLTAGAQAATQRYKNGVSRVTVSPTAQAAQSIDRMVSNFNQAAQSGKIERGLNRVSLQQWQNLASTKGANNYAPGVAASAPKTVAWYQRAGQAIEQLRQQIDQMPNATLADRKARAMAWFDGMNQIANGGI